MSEFAAVKEVTGPKRQIDVKSGNGIADQIDLLKTDIAGLATKMAEVGRAQLGDTVGTVQQTAKSKADDLEAAVRNSPMQSVAISVGIGFLLGLVLTR